MKRAALWVLPLLIVAGAAAAQEAAKPDVPALAPAPAVAKPPLQKLRKDDGRIGYWITYRPGVPEPGSTVTVEVELAELLDAPDPTFGKRRPVNDAEIRAVLVAAPAAAQKGKKAPRPRADARRAVRMSDAGTYGFTFTAAEAGIYGLHLRGSAGAAGSVEYDFVIPFGVWPLPEGQKIDAPPPMPDEEPAPLAGDLEHGRALCASRCRTDVAGALPAGKTPTFLESAFAVSHDDARLLQSMVQDGPRLTALERNDILYYLRSLHIGIQEFFPEAAAYLGKSFTINEYGRKRLNETLKLDLTDEQATAHVFVAFKGEGAGAPRLVDYDDRVGRDHLSKEDKLGYLVFLSMPGAKELALALGKEPVYSILGIAARGADGTRDAGLNKQLAAFVSQGRFNDAKSLRKGPGALAGKLLPVYLEAAELATMYYSDEREFTAFDDAFK